MNTQSTARLLWNRISWIQLAMFTCCIVGCGPTGAPPTLLPEHRDAMKQNLIKLGAKVTSEIPEAAYLSLRNNHIEIRELSATIEVELRTRKDVQDFASVNQAIASSFAGAADSNEFTKWLRTALAPQAPPVLHSEYGEFKVTLSRKPLRSTFTAGHLAQAE